jgi:formylglycine-generating enzyme required for sulfatase activity
MFKGLASRLGMLCLVIMLLSPAPGSAAQPAVDMIYVEAGTFSMGSTTAEFNEAVRLCQQAKVEDCAGYFEDELPAHQVYTDAFYIDMYEVTNADYAACVAAGVCDPPYDFSAYGYPSYYTNLAFSNFPVIHVTWFDAVDYCTWRGKRLPPEAEWEKAARWNPLTGTVTVWPWGSSIDGTRLNLCDESCDFSGRYPVDDGYANIAPVGSYPNGASHVGAYDMAGNVWEWVADYYDADYYAYSPLNNPTGPTTGTSRIRRGGAYNNPAAFTRSANRKDEDPYTHDSQLGIRCALSADTGTSGGGGTLRIGGQATVHVINDTLSLRTGPGTSYAEIERLPNGTIVSILDGPQAGGAYTWWYIRAPSGNQGWAVEYADNIQTLIPR